MILSILNTVDLVLDLNQKNYKLNLSQFLAGNMSDYSATISETRFTTYDWDNDEYSGNCASYYYGGWWMKKCFSFCLTCEGVIGQYCPVGKIADSDYKYYTYIKMLII